ncbi:MAG: hypothetical protein OXF27_21525 [Acidobacteria bacterium]|nr:hypothetical protein [Acidobacteriota bacterium]
MRLVLSVVVVALFASPALAQQSDAELAQFQQKHARVLSMPDDVPLRGSLLVPPSRQTERREYFGFRLLLGARYQPLIDDDTDWIFIGCQSVDPRVPWEDDYHGFYLIRVHALVFRLDKDGDLDTDNPYSTADTEESDEAICDLSRGIDTSFLEVPRDFDSAVVSLFAVASRRQYAEVVENVEREVILGRIRAEDDE